MFCTGSVPDLGEGWRDGEGMIALLRDITAYRGYGYEDGSIQRSCREHEQRRGHRTVAHGGLTGGLTWLGETGKACGRGGLRSFLDRHSGPGACAKAQRRQAACISREFLQRGSNVGVRMSGRQERLEKYQGLDSLSIKFMEHLPSPMNCV